jgi:epoxyqueuosine reductase
MTEPSILGIRVHRPSRETEGPSDPRQTAERLRAAALAAGFVRLGFAPTGRFAAGAERLERWLNAERHGEMAYLAGADRAAPQNLLADARTLVVVALPYSAEPLIQLRRKNAALLVGSVARYALGTDYHAVLKRKLAALADTCAELIGRPVLARACVDTAPLLEREAAARAGIAFVGKSTMAIVPGAGSYVVLGELLLDVELPASEPKESAHCGSCRACLDACPTGAFVDDYVLDARRCISYLTIELRGAIPRELRAPIGTRVFGCDVCQDVCPFNASPRERPAAPELAPRDDRAAVDLVGLLELGSADYRRFVKDSAMSRVSRTRLARNAAVALGNSGDPSAVAPLVRALERDPRALVRSHAAWGLGRLGGPDAREALERSSISDADPEVREEARSALLALGPAC